ncbi:hypothetical protein [Lentzea sp. NEAU-D7]|uniref:hypothetical protein n=1 Tax=Lentzea sp. NEAU-D7 TaxID=2994667 RepID=UPI00224AFB95|nr:hypothetical protein [Lentzea sp. NEAU-D7]MCX2949873.1 hypothetical protein [Lentzea sp. NEAU-D7]
MAPVKPVVQPSTENYPAQEHDHMQGLVNQNYDPNAATGVIDVWVQFGTKFRELAHDFNKIVNESQSGWNGNAAEAVRAALTKVSTFAHDTGSAFHATAGAIATQRDAAVQAHHSMPKPVDYNPLQIAGKWGAAAVIAPPAMIGGAIEMYTTHNEKVEAKQEAVRVMQQRDTTMMSAAQSMPAMDVIPEVTRDQGVTQTSSTTHSQSLSNSSTFQPRSTSTGMPGIPSPNAGNNNTTNPAWVAPGLTQPGNPNNPPGGGQNRPPVGPPGALPPGMLPPGVRPPGGGVNGRPGGGGPGGPGGGRGGGPGGPGGGGAGGRGMGPGGMAGVGGSGRGMGSFGPATPGGSAGVAGGPGGAAGAGGAGAAGRGGAAGAGGMGAGGGAGAGSGEEDKEHKSNYLIPTDEFFDDDRMVAPPVIGG